jgi:hypothetical protein
MPPACRDEGSSVLLVEGKNDCHVALALRQHERLESRFGIYECGSDENVLARMNALVVAPSPSRPRILGVLLDADTGPLNNRWAQVADRLSVRGYQCPTEPTPEGTILSPPPGMPSVGVWLMPDNRREGMLEDFLMQTASKKDIIVAKSAVFLARSTRSATFKGAHHSKAVIHTFLAWQDEPGKPLGQSVTARVLDPKNPNAADFLAWLNRLFPPSGAE